MKHAAAAIDRICVAACTPTASHAVPMRTATLAVISDTHLPRGQRRLPDACLERLRAADLILHAGDLSTLAVLAELQGLGPPVAAVHGNVDAEPVRRALPERRVV